MKIKRILLPFLILGLLLFAFSAKAQVAVERSNEIVKVGSKEYYMHHVKSGETLYAISRVYQVSVEEIERLNPELKDGLKTGYVIGIPARESHNPKGKDVHEADQEGDMDEEPILDKRDKTEIDEEYAEIEHSNDVVEIGGNRYYMHYVKPGQTLTSISKAYHVTIEEIERLNPEVKGGLKAGCVIGIPVRDEQEIIEKPVIGKEKPVAEPEEHPVEEPKKKEPKPIEELDVEPEPVIAELPALQPVEEPIEDPEPEIVVESIVDPEPKVAELLVEEPDMEPIPELMEEPISESVAETKVVPAKKSDVLKDPIVMKAGSHYVVQEGEDLYDIAKKFGIDVADFKEINPGLSNTPSAGTAILVPDIQNANDYIVHKVEYNERTSSLLKRWKVSESDFRLMNVSTGSHVFVNQIVLIPIDPVQIIVEPGEIVVVDDEEEDDEDEDEEEPIAVTPAEEKPKKNFLDELPTDVPECRVLPENALKRYKVALMVPLYLNDIGSIDLSKDKAAKSKKARSMSFLQFYEGFMMAAEKLKNDEGLRLDLTVIDVTDNVSTARQALSQIQGKDFDMIVGPFFGKSFEVIEEYAKANDILVINPLSTRSSVVDNSPNVVKVKPGDMGQILTISNLIRNLYSDANVFIVSKEKVSDTAFLNQLEHHLNMAVNDEVTVSGDEFLQFARDESERLEMGSKMVPTVDVEGQVYSTDEFEKGVKDKVVLTNSVKRYPYSSIGKLKSQLSGVRNNLIIAYGDDNVFATQVLNSLTHDADRFPITLVCVPDWGRFEKLLVDNLLRMNAIYVSDFFVDYKSDAAKRFVSRFRGKYASEPQEYAFEGYDIGMYFLTALMRYGDEVKNCLHCHDVPLLHTKYRFYYQNYLQMDELDGKENLYWSTYQFDKDLIELKPIDPFKKGAK